MLYTGLLRESLPCAERGAHLYWDRKAAANADGHTNSDTIGHPKRNSHSYTYSYTYRNSHSNSYAHFNTKGPSASSPNTASAPDTVATACSASPL